MPTLSVVKHKQFPVEVKQLTGPGQVQAIVSVFGNVDRVGDRVMPGAFKKSIDNWNQSGDRVPVIFSHDWSDVWKHIGVVDEMEEVPRGLKVVYTLDVEDNPTAAQVYRLLKRRTIREHSFAYEIKKERLAKDGATDLLELEIIEIGPTLKGANSSTELLAVKSLVEAGTKTPPWHIDPEHADCDGFAVVADETGEVVGCHETRPEAERHMAALYANVPDIQMMALHEVSHKGGRGVATDESDWDANAAMAAADSAADYRAICAGEHTTGEPDERTHWALPHHKRPGAPANANAVRAARAALGGARGGVQDLANRQEALRHLTEVHKLPAEVEGEAEVTVEDFETKAGRRLSAATVRELTAAADQAEGLAQHIRSLLSGGDSEDEGKDEDEAPSGKSNVELDPDLLTFKTTIERMMSNGPTHG